MNKILDIKFNAHDANTVQFFKSVFLYLVGNSCVDGREKSNV